MVIGSEFYTCFDKRMFDNDSRKIELSFIYSYNWNNLKKRRIIVMSSDVPILKLDISFNDYFDKLFQVKLFYFNEKNDKIMGVLTYEIRKSLASFRYWEDTNKIFSDDSDVSACTFSSDDDKLLFFAEDAIRYVVDNMYNDSDNTLFKTLNYKKINKFHLKELLIPILSSNVLDIYQQEFQINEKNFEMFRKKIIDARNDLNEQKEIIDRIIRKIKTRYDEYKYWKREIIDNYPVILIDIKRYFNSSFKILNLDEETLNKMVKKTIK